MEQNQNYQIPQNKSKRNRISDLNIIHVGVICNTPIHTAEDMLNSFSDGSAIEKFNDLGL